MNFPDDTIIALATPSGVGAISVIRISGNKAFELTDKFFAGKEPIASAKSHTIHYGKLTDTSGETIDDILISVFRGPHSYTGEDVIEINSHGNPLIAQKIIALFTSGEARLAEPGEFTRRAFLNNRLDLTQAEAVTEVISSRSEAALRGARNQLDGLLSAKVQELRTNLINTSSLIELELDFAEEDVEFLERPELVARIENIQGEIEALLSTYSFGRVIRDGVNVALVGQPNVGKSSILNYLLKEARAIVSHIPGTTRDVIREEITINGLLFRIFDTAGIRETTDEIELEGVERSRNAVRQADLILFINDTEQPYPTDLYNELLTLTPAGKIIKVLNKVDLKRESFESFDAKISAVTGQGVHELVTLIQRKALGSSNYTEHTAIVTNDRHFESLRRASENLSAALTSIDGKMSGEFISVDLRNAESSLAEIIGVVTTDDILNNIFAKFCIGK